MSESETPHRANPGKVPRNILPSVAEQKTAQALRDQQRKMAREMTILLDRRELIYEKLLRINDSLKPEPVSIHLLKLHLETLRKCVEDFDQVHMEIVANKPRDEREEQKEEYLRFETLHNQLYVALQTKIDCLTPALPSTSSEMARPVPPQHVYVQAAAPQLHAPFPVFDGNPENWFSFKSLFQSIMQRYANETPAMKILHLRNSLVGDVKDKIDQDVINTNDYDLAWRILENAYEDRRLIMDTHIDAVLHCPKVTIENRGQCITKLVETCTKHVDALRGHSFPAEGLAELILVNVMYKKLDKETQEQWETRLPRNELPEFQVFVDFLRERGRVLLRTGRSEQPARQQSTVPARRPAYAPRPAARSFIQTAKQSCPCCKEDHSIYRCPKFQHMNLSDRKAVVSKASLCYNCLRAMHRVSECPSEQGCKVEGCNRKHHSFLHPTNSASSLKPEPESVPETPTSTKYSATTLCTHLGAITKQVLLSTAQVLIVGKGGSTVQCRALLDSGSDSHIISENLASKLMVNMRQVDLPVSGLNDIQTRVNYALTTRIQSCVNDYCTSMLEFLVVPSVSTNLPLFEVDTQTLKIPTGLTFADPTFHVPGSVDLIIGNEIFFDLVRDGRIKINNSNLTLAETELGWVVSGYVQPRKPKPLPRVCQLNRKDTELNATLVKFWEIENMPTESTLSAAEAAVQEHFKLTHTRDEDGRYQVRLPFNHLKDQLGGSYSNAKKRLDRLMVSLARNPVRAEQYSEFMSEYLALGHMEEVSALIDEGYYIPHHAVFKESSSTTKTRVVFDASAKTTTGISLNDTLLVGPTVQSDLVSILLRFCTHQVALTADIPKMYRQVKLHQDDCKYQRILWYNQAGERTIYELQTVTYGVASSPHHATQALLQLAADDGEQFESAARVVSMDSYIDDFLTGGKTVEEVINIYNQLTQLLSKGGFGVHKFCSSSPEVLKLIPNDLHEKQIGFDSDVNDSIKTLGLIWNPTADFFRFFVRPSEGNSTTKRSVLSDIGRLFDPLGFLGPIITTAKLLMQDIWRLGIGWDEELPIELQMKWQNFQQQLPTINEMRKPRRVIAGHPTLIELHGYSDASSQAYGAVIYIKSISSDGTIQVNLLTSKSRVAPLKPVTIPRLELLAAKLLAELTQKVMSAMQIEFHNVTLYSDSQIVLCWLKKSPLSLNQFVSNRVASIVELTQDFRWCYVRTNVNPADCISRGALPNELVENELWWKGPPTLWETSLQPQDPFPFDINDQNIPELRKRKALTIIAKSPHISLDRLSNYRQLQRAWVYVLRYAKRGARTHPFNAPISADEMMLAETTILRLVQQQSFQTLLSDIQSKQTRRYNLSNLAPFVGNDGLIRVGGRLKYSAIPYDGKHQILLPEQHFVTTILVRKLHEENLHVGHSGLLVIVRERYWPVRAKKIIKKIISNCIVCAKLRARPERQFMGDLPKHRVNPAPPFSLVGIDYAGPFTLTFGTRGRNTYKAYVVVFICMTVKAIHFELVTNLTTENFIACLNRFVGRRGLPSDIFTDNGTSFVGANNELADMRKLFEDELHRAKLQEFCATRGLKWHFIPPRSPHFGGIWEAGVKSMKYHLKRVVGETRLTYEEMLTFLVRTEAILNSRPLCPMSDDPCDAAALTPSHFLIGRSLLALPESSLMEEKVGRLNRWQHVKYMQEHFWRRWSREYLHHLQSRQKWSDGVRKFTKGDLVLLVEENLPPQQWRLGRIEILHPGEDNIVRVVTVRTASGSEFKRAVTKIALLPVDLEGETQRGVNEQLKI
ncbi:uncharacterized protein LOC129743526 [Uranotaenia lowii]|uniref:uncharacterized protein LOC129743526 n=1 Tax=Uranotaenia lowii TaxID=190385 RepID=UPI0024796839|nr:uncharacterized protein LOC129743526 [Uranotaenia lowii]